MKSINELFCVPIVDLGDQVNSRYKGIFSPKSDLTDSIEGSIQVYDEDKAQIYDERHYYPEGQVRLLDRALRFMPDSDPDLILDIGSGSGNSITAALRRFPKAAILATDISPSLLRIMKQKLEKNKENVGRVALSCIDVHKPVFKNDTFDLAIGSAILHHLIDPRAAVVNTLKAVKSGGCAVFFEPFEYGCAILRLIHLMILNQDRLMSKNDRLTPEVVDFLLTLNNDYEFRGGVSNGIKEITKSLDDKWLFTKNFFEKIAVENAVNRTIIYSNHEGSLNTVFEDYVLQNFWLGKGWKKDVLPEWAWEIVRQIDKSISNEMKADFMIEATTILHK